MTLLESIINGSDEVIARKPEKKLEIQNKDTIGFQANTKAKLDEYYKKGIRLMEIDLEWTDDEKLIVNCDNGMTIEELEQWMKDHIDAYIITDMVGDTSDAMKYIKYNLKEVKERFIPQVKDMEEYYLVYTKGFKNIIFKIPDDKYTDKEILEFVKLYDHFGVAISEYRANRGFLRKLQKQGLTTYIY
jgi:lipoteichoic acid synthase